MAKELYIIDIIPSEAAKGLYRKMRQQESRNAGFAKRAQRHKCKDCGCQCAPALQRGNSGRGKLEAAWLHSHRLSPRAAAKFFQGQCAPFVCQGESLRPKQLPMPQPHNGGAAVELDERNAI
jgi:hypothetical protein